MLSATTYKVLLIDTQIESAQKHYRLLRKTGLPTDIALSTQSAFNLLNSRSKHYGCIIICIKGRMAEKDLAFLAEIKKTLGIQKIPVILLCDENSEKIIKKAHEFDVFECLTVSQAKNLCAVLKRAFYLDLKTCPV